MKRLYKGTVIACGGYSAETGGKALIDGDADLVAIGRPLIAKPDYVIKIRQQLPLVSYDVEMLNQLF
ncbi:hypothetical protein [Photobacterium indicum]|uniref:oxidoreductase n=1 Tax=Photobacterium indicum TaxID=81447 RepID=UPI003D0B6B45